MAECLFNRGPLETRMSPTQTFLQKAHILKKHEKKCQTIGFEIQSFSQDIYIKYL